MTRRAVLALAALWAILAITAAWWALALWPAGGASPAWLERTRAVCFGVGRSGLPDAGGWILLVGEPAGMLGFLMAAWGGAVREALGGLRRTARGRIALAGATLALVAGGGAATARVTGAAPAEPRMSGAAGGTAAFAERFDRPAPALSLIDQRGDTVRLEQFGGRPVIVVFAYGHCETVCPLMVHDAARALEQTRALGTTLLVVTLDPWRDTPARLAHIARAWALPSQARLLGGSVDAVERTLDRWNVARARDEVTGEIVHQTSAYLIDRKGRLTFVASGDASRLTALLERL